MTIEHFGSALEEPNRWWCSRCSVIMLDLRDVERHRCPSDVERDLALPERCGIRINGMAWCALPAEHDGEHASSAPLGSRENPHTGDADALGDAAGRAAFEAFMRTPGPAERDAFSNYRDATRALHAAELEHAAAVKALGATLAAVQTRWREALAALNRAIVGE